MSSLPGKQQLRRPHLKDICPGLWKWYNAYCETYCIMPKGNMYIDIFRLYGDKNR